MTYLLLRIMDVRSNGGSVREALRFGDVNTVHDTPETNSDTIEGEDEDVANERYRIEQIEHGSQNAEVSFLNFFFCSSSPMWAVGVTHLVLVPCRQLVTHLVLVPCEQSG